MVQISSTIAALAIKHAELNRKHCATPDIAMEVTHSHEVSSSLGWCHMASKSIHVFEGKQYTSKQNNTRNRQWAQEESCLG